MQVPVSPIQADKSLSGMYALLSVEHVLRRCRSGLWWNSEQERPLVMSTPEPLPVGEVRGPLDAEALDHPRRTIFTAPTWFVMGDAQALRVVLRLHLLYKWVEAKRTMIDGLEEGELTDAQSQLPVELRSMAIDIAYATSYLMAGSTQGPTSGT